MNRDIARRLMSLDKIRFPCAAQVFKQYKEKAAQIEGAKLTDYVYIPMVL
ncbi:aminoglycoside phosphotransferase family enzyme [Pedobacter cryoconitis]|nr:hypothetical protein [Pedobacter cryoconitis]MBB6269897.1 aminoglycoside phosphotransferase family enzyme [Pedobacter cryoconitis]